ncbi:toll/interleukin-1 receptor domain-containing protein [Bradyrhizobium sp. AUGA SZCCT0283]|uniref:toll/interleukin-1 receptor domain-containing protein n=1 Tax=Bradyrhizobium sp. AUGA SZCCT0283 TaxID=2807671 RepID=UPI001BA49AFF|nr:toll/interleukin-1 receptor domain-containing protein [Bradyrhizobium sp. AUGA SZCCT0283]MBR1273220.1 toll/interleukin-1 receptor domain-containing protein [Bradyrhizobium sp. AUGA SZCCT0283]
MAEERLHVFISYSSEDRDLATAIAEELRRAFNPTILKLTIDVEFSLGSNWRERLKADLDDTDILLVVATGKQKVSHSFTGFEVGYFDASISHSPKMEHFPTQDRIMIPIAVFTKTPETMSDIQALQINAPFEPMVVDPAALKNPASPAGGTNIAMKKTPIFKLFKRIQGIINHSIQLSEEELEAFNAQLLESSARLLNVIHLELQKRVYQENFPERKIVVRTSLAAGRPGHVDALSDATVEFFGRFDSFGFQTPQGGPVPWSQFAENIGEEDIARCWTSTIQMLVSAAMRGDFRDNRQVVTSQEKDRAFRMFVARSVIYYSGVREFHIYIVEIRYKDYGDPTTTMLLKAISIGLQYRFMFLEGKTSEFSPNSFNATLQPGLRGKIAEMIQQLDYLLWYSQDAGLNEPESILQILGDLPTGEIDRKSRIWEEQKSKLYAAAHKMLATDDAQLLQNKVEFVTVLQAFCDSTRVLNEDFTSKVLLALGRIVSGEQPKVGLNAAA